jgi:hypothetical protein
MPKCAYVDVESPLSVIGRCDHLRRFLMARCAASCSRIGRIFRGSRSSFNSGTFAADQAWSPADATA